MNNTDRKIGLSIIVVLLALLNTAGIFKLLIGAESLSKIYTLFSPSSIKLMVIIPVTTLISLVYIWLGKKTGIILAIIIYLIVIILDLYYQVWAHAIMATAGFGLLMFFCWQSRNFFNVHNSQN